MSTPIMPFVQARVKIAKNVFARKKNEGSETF